jgi:hypothetical protein
MYGEHENFRPRAALENFVRCFQTVKNRHSDIEQGHIRARFCRFCHRFPSVSRLRYYLPSGLSFQQSAQSGSKDFVIICYQQP